MNKRPQQHTPFNKRLQQLDKKQTSSVLQLLQTCRTQMEQHTDRAPLFEAQVRTRVLKKYEYCMRSPAKRPKCIAKNT